MLGRIRVRRYEREIARKFRAWFDLDPLPIYQLHDAAAENLVVRALYNKTMEHLNSKQRHLDAIKKQAALIDATVRHQDADVVQLLQIIRNAR